MELVATAWQHGLRGADLERLGREVGSLGDGRRGPPDAIIESLIAEMRRLGEPGADDTIFRHLDAMRGRHGYYPPGAQPGDDPGHMRGPGGPPDDPGTQHPGGGHHGDGAGGSRGGG
jgi:hypothetical protein